MRNRRSSACASFALAATLWACSTQPDEPVAPARAAELRYDFDDAPLDGTPAGFTSEVGAWRVVALPEGGRGLAQLAESEGPVFNVALAAAPISADLELSVRFRAQAGEIDQGGGPVWRALDASNYYITRYNPLEENFRVYKVEGGKRTQLGSAKLAADAGWHEIGVQCTGDRMRCSFDGKELLDVRDSSLRAAGRVGLWTKADAVTWFDELRVRPADAAGN